MVCKANPPPIHLSLSGCGFLGVYHIGVVCAFKEHAPEVIDGKMAGCSAGSLVAACAICGCCLGQMCSDALEIAIRARSRALGPLHPTFSIVDIIRNGLRRILPPNAHELCSGRLFISLTRWKDNKNVIISQYHNREELIQVLICSSFVPYWSGIIPLKFRGEYYWDGGLTNNHPIIDEGTILVSPFAGESDICPRDESGSFYSVDFRGTDISCTQENLYRVTRALFPPNLSVLKQICWRGYIDGLKFLQTRNMIKPARLTSKATISSVLGSHYTEPANEDEKELRNGGITHDVARMYVKRDNSDDDDDDDEDMDDETMDDGISSPSDSEIDLTSSQVTFSPFCAKVIRKKELPTSLFAVFADARQKEEDPIRSYFYDSNLYKIWSFMALPVTLPIDLTYAMTKRMVGSIRPLNYIWSLFADDSTDKYCYHVNDCECTESRPSSIAPLSRRRRQRSQTRLRPTPLMNIQRQSSVPIGTMNSSSYRSDTTTTDDEDTSTTINNETQFLSPVSDLIDHPLPPPDLVTSTDREYCNHLQQMAELSNQQRLNEQSSIPFFGKDTDSTMQEHSQMPTTAIEKTLLFN